jgi:hypothetical protein
MKNWSSDAELGAPENAPYSRRREIPQLGLKFEGKKGRHNLWALLRGWSKSVMMFSRTSSPSQASNL